MFAMYSYGMTMTTKQYQNAAATSWVIAIQDGDLDDTTIIEGDWATADEAQAAADTLDVPEYGAIAVIPIHRYQP
jgi:hypothetical protein